MICLDSPHARGDERLPQTSAVRALIQDYCIDCHNPKDHKGKLDLKWLLGQDLRPHRSVWDEVLWMIQNREMPPQETPPAKQPSDLLLEASASALAVTFSSLDRLPVPVSGIDTHQALLDQYCLSCHNAQERKGDLDLDTIRGDRIVAHPKTWEAVIKRLEARQMPPSNRQRPNDTTYNAVIAHLTRTLDTAARKNPQPGRTETLRRLTRTEYQNAIRDLLGLEFDLAALLPGDELSHGFDNITVGSLSPTLMQQYLSAAKTISKLALGRPIQTPRVSVLRMPMDLTQEQHLPGLPLGTRGGGLVPHHFPVDGEYEVRLKLFRDRYEVIAGLKDEHQLDLLLDGETIQRFTVRPPEKRDGEDQVDRHLVARFSVAAGRHQLGAAFVRKTAALKGGTLQPWLASFNEERHKRAQPALYSFTVTGPFRSSGPGESRSRRQILGTPRPAERPENRARAILTRLMRLAYRRPIQALDLETPFRFYHETQAKEGFEAGIEMGLRTILTSVDFLFRVEADPPGLEPGTVYPINDLHLASRLSFFLWSSLPDTPLLRAAERGRLSDPKELSVQINRMLRDPRARALITNFASQWLHLRNVSSLAPDPRRFMDFDDNLRQSMHRETELFLLSILREDRSVLDILRADYTFLDERLAKHYNIPHIYGSRFRRVELTPASHRGGLLRQASILALTSYADRTSPVRRGSWILSNLLGTPPKPPPPGVEDLGENALLEEPQSVRERLAVHRENPTCAICHDAMDPIGFAMEEYDAIGRFRTQDSGVPIDAKGVLSDGSAFDGTGALQRALLKQPERFVSTLTGKLLTYALGRGIEPFDAPAIRKIVRDGRKDDYSFSSLIKGIAGSPSFRLKTAQ